ncbi:hypothetical protein CALVIDRAFT_322185 [Calocera viscosa TUFC12733]|uniref:Virilizer N-terminal domain-containing protein n=1 Tax=Calocera viscosa (strain TUFC12733) TaxID=1330018 RepID=A0A167QNL3_CALVF|nr:hypothetical protein CALVIDRAFT_322185 [Calocera viscosa TUFC12733]
MPLLFLSTLTPTNSLAAVRFSRPVHVSSLRIIPSSLAPFPYLQDFSSETEPASFPLEIFFNWQTLASGNDKPRASNILLHSTLQYTGEELEYEIDHDGQLVTRLLILKGPFTSMTLAVYGRDAAEPKKEPEATPEELPVPAPNYEPVPLPGVSLAPLPAALDPGRITDPLALPRRLLSSTATNSDIIDIMRRHLAFPHASSSEVTLDQVLNSYEIGEDWIQELMEVLEQPIDPAEITEEALQNINERLLEIVAQSPAPETISRLLSVLSLHPVVLVDSLLPIILDANLDASLYPVLVDASSSSAVCQCLHRIGLPGGLDPPIYQRITQNMHMWENLRDGVVDLPWISTNTWLPGFLPSVLEVLGTVTDLSTWPHNMKLRVAIASLLALICTPMASGDTAGLKARAIMDVWLSEPGIAEIMKDALNHENIKGSLSSSFGEPLLEKVRIITASMSTQRNGSTGHTPANGHGGASPTNGSIEAAAAYLTVTSKRWPSESLQQLHTSLKTVLGRVSGGDDKRPIMHAFWRQNTSAVQCIALVLLEATRQLSDQNWELTDATPARDLVQVAQSSLQILHHMVPEFGLLSGMVPLVVRSLISLLVSLRQPTYATRYSSETSIRAHCERLIEHMSEMDAEGNFVHSGADAILPVLLQDSLRWDEGIDPLSRATAAADLLIVLLDVDHTSKDRTEAWANQLIMQLPMMHSLLCALDPVRIRQVIDLIRDIDDGEFGVIDWLVVERLTSIKEDAFVGGSDGSKAEKQVATSFADFRAERSLEFVENLSSSQLEAYLEQDQPVAVTLAQALWSIWDRQLSRSHSLAELILSRSNAEPRLRPVSAAILIATNTTKDAGNDIMVILPKLVPLLDALETDAVHKPDQLLRAVGAAIAFLPELEEQITVEWQRGEITLESALSLLDRALGFFPLTEGVVTGIPVPTLSEGTAARFKGLVEVLLGAEKAETLTTLLSRLSLPLISTPLPEPTNASSLLGSTLRTLVQSETVRPPTTPLSRPLSGLDGGLRTAPPSARKTSPVASLAKNYSKNDFRELRTLPQARLNTSRPPSRHVDDFELHPEGAVVVPVPAASAAPAAIPAFGAGQVPVLPTGAQSGVMPFYTL